jgi:hypothetical protein
MPSAEAYSYVSSRLVKGIARLGGPVHGFVPAMVEERLQRKLNGNRRRSSAAATDSGRQSRNSKNSAQNADSKVKTKRI